MTTYPNTPESTPLSPVGPSDNPQFGLIDVIESLTAMRHEWRSQSRESRELLDSIRTAIAQVQSVETTISEKLSATTDTSTVRQLVNAIIDFDIQLTRAVEATQSPTPENEKAIATIDQAYQKLGFFKRRACRIFYESLRQQLNQAPAPDTTAQGLQLMLADLRRTMKNLSIIRIDTLNQPFDGELMNAIATVPAGETPSGYIAEQISPAYRYGGQVIRYAQVRMAQ